MNKSETQKYVQGLQAQIRDLQKHIADLESGLSVKGNLLKIKNGLCGENPYGVHYDLGEGKAIRFIGFEREEAEHLFNLVENSSEKDRIAELEDRHQSDCITINKLHTALDVMTEKYQRLREMHGL